jgi:hypothetical protein
MLFACNLTRESAQRGEVGAGGVTVAATGGGKKYVGVTDGDGWFHIQVPPGKLLSGPKPQDG